MARWLRREGCAVSRKRVRRLMRKMGLQALYQRPSTSVPHPEHRVYPYLLRDRAVERANEAWCADVTYIPLHRGFLPEGAVVALVQHDGCLVLCGGPRGSPRAVRTASDLQHRPRQPVHQPGVHSDAQRRRRADLDGRQGPLDGQRLHRAAVALAQVRVASTCTTSRLAPRRGPASAGGSTSTMPSDRTRRSMIARLMRRTRIWEVRRPRRCAPRQRSRKRLRNMNLESTLTWPLSCPKDGVHLCGHGTRLSPMGSVKLMRVPAPEVAATHSRPP